jgi:hypothetical protein
MRAIDITTRQGLPRHQGDGRYMLKLLERQSLEDDSHFDNFCRLDFHVKEQD